MALPEALQAHLQTGHTTLCRAWSLTRKDGTAYGFTDHDRDLAFGGLTYRADTGLAASAVQQATGLSVDNGEAVGVLSDASLREEDIEAGRFDGAEVVAWLVNWQDPSARVMQFRGTLGEISRGGGAFTAELRGLTEGLNQPKGRVYQATDTVVLGDAQNKFDLTTLGYVFEGAVEEVEQRKLFRFAALDGFDDLWFENGRCEILSGAAEGLVGWVKNDRLSGAGRSIELWEPLGAAVAPGDLVRFYAGYDGRLETARLKFNNVVNFRGFPHIPGEDWMMAYPSSGREMDGGSLDLTEFPGAKDEPDFPGGTNE
jgi:uncharacterized phage protein (TIGR02218 family)